MVCSPTQHEWWRVRGVWMPNEMRKKTNCKVKQAMRFSIQEERKTSQTNLQMKGLDNKHNESLPHNEGEECRRETTNTRQTIIQWKKKLEGKINHQDHTEEEKRKSSASDWKALITNNFISEKQEGAKKVPPYAVDWRSRKQRTFCL